MSLLLVSTTLSFLNAFLPIITKRISSLFVHKKDMRSIKEEMDKILAEIKSLSIRNEFPRYARLKRKLTKLVDEKRDEDKSYVSSLSKVSSQISNVAQGLLTVGSAALFWWFRFEGVTELPEDWLFPLGYVLSWPILSPGVISFPVWFLITNSASKLVASTLQP